MPPRKMPPGKVPPGKFYPENCPQVKLPPPPPPSPRKVDPYEIFWEFFLISSLHFTDFLKYFNKIVETSIFAEKVFGGCFCYQIKIADIMNAIWNKVLGKMSPRDIPSCKTPPAKLSPMIFFFVEFFLISSFRFYDNLRPSEKSIFIQLIFLL